MQMAEEIVGRTLSEGEVIRAVRWRFRICNYLFNLAAMWFLIGAMGLWVSASHADATDNEIPVVMELIGSGIFSVAFVLTLAIYRCPVCGKYLSRFRPRKEYCPSCGAKIKEAKQRWSVVKPNS